MSLQVVQASASQIRARHRSPRFRTSATGSSSTTSCCWTTTPTSSGSGCRSRTGSRTPRLTATNTASPTRMHLAGVTWTRPCHTRILTECQDLVTAVRNVSTDTKGKKDGILKIFKLSVSRDGMQGQGMWAELTLLSSDRCKRLLSGSQV